MCLICVEYAKGKLTTKEARRALGEMVTGLDRAHVAELTKTLDEADASAGAAKHDDDDEG
jgi:hypothetical protein